MRGAAATRRLLLLDKILAICCQRMSYQSSPCKVSICHTVMLAGKCCNRCTDFVMIPLDVAIQLGIWTSWTLDLSKMHWVRCPPSLSIISV